MADTDHTIAFGIFKTTRWTQMCEVKKLLPSASVKLYVSVQLLRKRSTQADEHNFASLRVKAARRKTPNTIT